MDTRAITPERLSQSVIAVPPLARNTHWEVDQSENQKIVRHIEKGGVNTLLYGGNAVFYHIRLSEYESALNTLVQIAGDETLIVPSVGPSFGLMMDQAEILKRFEFPTAMILPQSEIADSQGRAVGIERFADAYGKPIVLYLKHDRWLEPDSVEKIVNSGVVSWIKYAVVRDDPAQDDYLSELVQRVPTEIMVSGIGEQPAIVHMRDFGIGSFTSGCVCVNPGKSMEMLAAIKKKDYARAEAIRAEFEPLEDLRNEINPIRVLHAAVDQAGIAATGPMLPMLGELSDDQLSQIAIAAQQLLPAT